LDLAIRKELNLRSWNGGKNIDAAKQGGSFSEGEMEHIDDELDEEQEDPTNDDLEKHLAKKPKTNVIKTTKKGKGVNRPSPLKKGKMKKKTNCRKDEHCNKHKACKQEDY
jgi:hypothetical protein